MKKANKNLATLVLVESTQSGRLLQARLEISTAQGAQFVEVTEQTEIDRLSHLYEKYCISDRNLTGRFKAFLNQREGSESIDAIDLTQEQQRASKADYFLNNRRIVCELKSLETDTSSKMGKALAKYRGREEWPVIFGTVKVDSRRLLKDFPDKEQINLEVINAVTDSLEGIVERANRQIRDTKRTFSLWEASGLLIILNDLVDSLPPNLVLFRIQKLLAKRTATGEPRFPFLSAVLIIHTAHAVKLHCQLDGLPILAVRGIHAEREIEEGELDELIESWSAFEHLPLLDAPKNLADLTFQRFPDERAKKGNDRPS